MSTNYLIDRLLENLFRIPFFSSPKIFFLSPKIFFLSPVFFSSPKIFFLSPVFFLSPKMFFLSPKIFFCRQKIFLPTVSKTLRLKYYTIFYGAPMLTKMGNTVSLIFNWIFVSIIAKNNFIEKHWFCEGLGLRLRLRLRP